ncbi:MAG: hypothetical protein AB7R40_25210 [Nitrospiraceae bacterium]
MKHWKRIQYALFFSVAVVMIIALVASFLEINIAPLILSGTLFVPIFLVAYLLAPLFEKFIKES